MKIIPQHFLDILNPTYLASATRGEESIAVTEMREAVGYDCGYSATHRVIRMFWHMIETEFSADDIRKLLLFWTASSVPTFQISDPEDRVCFQFLFRVLLKLIIRAIG